MRYIILFISLLLLAMPLRVQAQEISLGLSPKKSHIVAKPGTTISLPYTLSNYGDATLTTMYLMILENADSVGNYTVLPITERSSIQPDFTFVEAVDTPFLLLAKEQFSGTLVIDIPSDIKDGDYYYVLAAKTQSSQGFETSSTIKINGAIATPIFISVSKNGITQSKLTSPILQLEKTFSFSFFPSLLFLDSKNPIKGHVLVENQGKNRTALTGTFQIDRLFSILPFNNKKNAISEKDILAHSRMKLDLPQTSPPPTGKYRLGVLLSAGAQDEQTYQNLVIFPFTYTSYLLVATIIAGIGVLYLKRYTNT